ncbi:peptidoglycan-binding protein [Calidifontibacter sp. DB0510]|uniref:Peptidoglycan-binding protein n=1 Tax=Metallococcus carri TaxID=1656884 RepID=A0A967B1I2_9MICO|nr:peptidoglycan-binding domain-containing protein [Metallococcus carri]NHN56274.1 peptidoglycan-binding protein [Metallococcus carri]NOP38674.1 peptidoglycan-binding protein [Calidifontibacter sp. DB2511S]
MTQINRRTVALVPVAALAAAAAVPAGRALAADPADPALAVVDMEAAVKAAQIDPRRADHTLTPGAKASVLAIERALQARRLLAAEWVDGYFGSQTVAAYTAYQRSLGYRGLAANGIPGRASLSQLGRGRFTVTRPVGPGVRTTWTGKTVNARTAAMLRAAQRRAGVRIVLDQGSYNPGGDPTSVGTHDGGGVVDINVRRMPTATRTALLRALRRVGFAAWLRNPQQDDWPWHIHAVAISDTDLAPQAQHQVGDFYLGLNGLSGRDPDDGPRVVIRTWEEVQR